MLVGGQRDQQFPITRHLRQGEAHLEAPYGAPDGNEHPLRFERNLSTAPQAWAPCGAPSLMWAVLKRSLCAQPRPAGLQSARQGFFTHGQFRARNFWNCVHQILGGLTWTRGGCTQNPCSPQLYAAPPYGHKVSANCITWCIHVAKWAKLGQNGLKMGTIHLLVHPKRSSITFGKCVFDPFLTHFWPQTGPFSRHFRIFHGPNRVTTSSKRAKNTCLSVPIGPGSLLEKHIFDPFLTHFDSQNGPV